MSSPIENATRAAAGFFKLAKQHQGPVECLGLERSSQAYLLARLFREKNCHMLVLAPTKKEAKILVADLEFFLQDLKTPDSETSPQGWIMEFPAYHILPFKGISYHTETAANRITTLSRLAHSGTPAIVVTTPQAVASRLIPKNVLNGFGELVMVREELDRESLVERLVSGGYVRNLIVEEPGDFCVRGSIVDVFGPPYSLPMRIEFYGDEVDSIRFFSPSTQRTVKKVEEAVILPATEAVVSRDALQSITHRIREKAVQVGMPVTKIREVVESLKTSLHFPGIEGFVPLLYENGGDTLFDYLPQNTLCAVLDPVAVHQEYVQYFKEVGENYEKALAENRLSIPPAMTHLDTDGFGESLRRSRPLLFPSLALTGPREEEKNKARMQMEVLSNTELAQSLKGFKDRDHLLKPLVDWIKDKRSLGYSVIMVCGSKMQAERLENLLSPYGVSLSRNQRWMSEPDSRCKVVLGSLSSGFVWPHESLSIVTETEIFGPKHRRRKMETSRPRTELLDLAQLSQGDHVVHVDHGIARYGGLVKMELNGVANDFLLLEYRDGDKLYLPVDKSNLIQKYRTIGEAAPALEKLGGKSWETVKSRVKKSVEKIAGELLKVYAVRKIKQGHAFSPTDSYFAEFEAGFEYEETPDQARAINDVLTDMESPRPMDRLVCGDVGYGKTEVALRASFKAVSDSKQVAFITPTTILSEQHYRTFLKRYDGYPVKIACLNRFRKDKEKKEILQGLAEGAIDIIIGTHSVLQKSVEFKDLRLVLIDEEQRFGVRHKEMLKKVRATVDVLALTATPIPRTLHMSMVGIRDISVINTPPEQRRPITTYVSKFDEVMAAEAIRAELARKGQTFFVHNRVQSIDAMAHRLQELVPEVRIGVAHGQMSETLLEKAMMKFVNQEIDLLVCTTIIESGLDIPAANTILINRADMFGLAQIYQLRGRVGRGDDQAYAYLFIPDESVLTRDAQRRLKVLMEHSDLGAGFAIAMSDLQIRGGGAILGSAQSGQIAAVGYEMYLQLMEAAISQLKGQDTTPPLDPEINVDFSAFIPEWYVPDTDQRLLAYRRLSRMELVSEVGAFSKEMKDRFGNIPTETNQLFYKIMFKILCRDAGIRKMDLSGKNLHLTISPEHQGAKDELLHMIRENYPRFQLNNEGVLKVSLDSDSVKGRTVTAKNVLKDIAGRVK
ncbi:MAG: transcription-repair coupling factor [Desulfatibacillum sp.]|nr:transcription-repair coupling factor [Desulfatibacillum sp.]